MTTFSLQATNPYQTFVVSSGTIYTADVYGVVAGIVAGSDLRDLLADGCVFLPGAGAGRDNLVATGAPGVGNDNTQDYGVGSLWVDIIDNAAYICTGAATGAATWTGYPSSSTVSAGGSGTVGHLDVYPTTAAKGRLRFNATDNTNDDIITITNAAFGQASTLTIPDPGNATASYVLTKGTQTISGNITLSGTNAITGATTFTNSDLKLLGSSTGVTTFTSGNAGASNFTITIPGVTDTLATIGTAQTFTAAQTFTNSDIKLLGSSTGANTLTALNGSATNYTTSVPAVTGVLATTTGANLFYADITKCGTQKDSTTATLANVTGLTQTVAVGTYAFVIRLPGSADGTGGVKYAFKLTTTVLTSIEATGRGCTASAIAVQHTTTATDQALLFDQAAAVIYTEITGSMVVSTGGTIDLQTAQHTNSGTSSTYVGATMEFVRIA